MLFKDWKTGDPVVHILLSRENLPSLLAKLDGNPPNSACTIYRDGGDGEPALFITAMEEAESHGAFIHPMTELAIRKRREQT